MKMITMLRKLYSNKHNDVCDVYCKELRWDGSGKKKTQTEIREKPRK